MYLRISSLRFLIVVGRTVLSSFPLSRMIHSPGTKGSCFFEADWVERLGFGRFSLHDCLRDRCLLRIQSIVVGRIVLSTLP